MKINRLIKTKLIGIAMIFCVFTVQAIEGTPEESQMLSLADAQKRVSRYGTVIDSKSVGVSGLTAWTVEKNGRSVVLYTTADAAVVFTGIIWDAETGRNISDQFLPANGILPPKSTNSGLGNLNAPMNYPAAMDGKFAGELLESMITVDSLLGYKEGAGSIADTVYIIIDPRCSYCRKAYNETREYIRRGYSIKWIPAVALGDYPNGIQLATTIVESKDKSILDRVLGKHEKIKTQPTAEIEQAIIRNTEFMFAAFKQNGGEAGVPVAFFLDHRSGSARMLTGVSELPILDDIFGKK